MVETSQKYLLTVLFSCIAVVYVSLNFIWNGSF